DWIDVTSHEVLEWLQSSRLQVQLFILVVAAIVVAALPLVGTDWINVERQTAIELPFALLWMTGTVCAVSAAASAKYHRPAALLLSGGAGLCTVITFAWLSAPDLALTQLTVEVVTVVLILLGLRWLPPRIPVEGEDETPIKNRVLAFVRRSRDFVLATL